MREEIGAGGEQPHLARAVERHGHHLVDDVGGLRVEVVLADADVAERGIEAAIGEAVAAVGHVASVRHTGAEPSPLRW